MNKKKYTVGSKVFHTQSFYRAQSVKPIGDLIILVTNPLPRTHRADRLMGRSGQGQGRSETSPQPEAF